MATVRDILSDSRAVLIFDFDGVLAAYEYGEHNHNACKDAEWPEYCKTHNIYENARPLKVIQEYVGNIDSNRLFVCSQDGPYARAQKTRFVQKYYPQIPANHIFLVETNKKKLDVLREIQRVEFPVLEDKYFVMVDDTIEVLTNIQENSEFSTAHISSFLE